MNLSNKILIAIAFILASLNIGSFGAMAQGLERERPYTINIYLGAQDPADKSFRVVVEVDSAISSDRTSFNWKLPQGLQNSQGESEFSQNDIDLTQGLNTFELILTPISQVDGYLELGVRSFGIDDDKSVQAYQIAPIKIDSDLNLTPQSDASSNLALMHTLAGFTKNLTFLLASVLIILLIVKKIYSIYKPPLHKPKTPQDSRILQELSRT